MRWRQRGCATCLSLIVKYRFLMPVAPRVRPMMKTAFRFLRPGRLVEGDLELVLVRRMPAKRVIGHVPAYEFELRHPSHTGKMGSIRLRIGSASALRCPGHIGYEVKPRYRGHRYAARSCRLLLPLARAHGLKAVWL